MSSTRTTSSPSMLSSKSFAKRTMPGAPFWFANCATARKSTFTGTVSSRASAVRKKTEPFNTPISFSSRPAYLAEISAPTSRMRCSICSAVNRILSMAGALIRQRSLRQLLRQTVLNHKILDILLIEHLNIHVRIDGAQQADLAILLGHMGLLHSSQLDVQVEFREVEVRRESFLNIAVLIPLERKTAGLVIPGDAVEIQQIGEDLFAGMPKFRAPRLQFIRWHDTVAS